MSYKTYAWLLAVFMTAFAVISLNQAVTTTEPPVRLLEESLDSKPNTKYELPAAPDVKKESSVESSEELDVSPSKIESVNDTNKTYSKYDDPDAAAVTMHRWRELKVRDREWDKNAEWTEEEERECLELCEIVLPSDSPFELQAYGLFEGLWACKYVLKNKKIYEDTAILSPNEVDAYLRDRKELQPHLWEINEETEKHARDY
jgi:hypothetical protein